MQNPKPFRIANAPLCAALLCLAAAAISFGQFETATVLGAAMDPRAGVIARAHVSLANLDTGTSQSILTDDSGNYQFLEVRVGRYRVIAEAPGFKKLETAEFRVDVGARQRVDVRLQLGEVNEAAALWSATPAIAARWSIARPWSICRSTDGRMLRSHCSAPGLRLAYGLAKRESSFNVSGLRSQFNNFILRWRGQQCGAGIQGDHQHLQRRVRAGGRRRGQRVGSQRHQPELP